MTASQPNMQPRLPIEPTHCGRHDFGSPGGYAGELGDQLIGFLRLVDEIGDRVEVPGGFGAHRRSQRLDRLIPAALFERHVDADADTDLLGDLRTGQRLRAGDRIHPTVVGLLGLHQQRRGHPGDVVHRDRRLHHIRIGVADGRRVS